MGESGKSTTQAAKARQGTRTDIVEIVPPSEKETKRGRPEKERNNALITGKSREQAAAMVGVNPRYVSDAKAKIGEMLKELPKQPRIENIRGCTTATSGVETKESAVQRLGLEKTQAHRFEVLADNPDVIEQVKAEPNACQLSLLSSRCDL